MYDVYEQNYCVDRYKTETYVNAGNLQMILLEKSNCFRDKLVQND